MADISICQTRLLNTAEDYFQRQESATLNLDFFLFHCLNANNTLRQNDLNFLLQIYRQNEMLQAQYATLVYLSAFL